MTAEDNQPDWDKIAEKFDIWLPQLKPVGDALLDNLKVLPGEHILDVGSGTGEPAISLAKNMAGKIQITGIDAAEGMVKVAENKVRAEKLSSIHFQTMPAEKLDFKDNTFDRVLSRFGVMLFEDPAQGLKEMCRVLKPGGHCSLAVWSTPETMRTLYWTYAVFENRIDEASYPPLAKVTSLGAPGIIEDMLLNAGFQDPKVEAITFYYNFDHWESFWNAIESSDILKMQFDALPESEHASISEEVKHHAKEYITSEGVKIPHDFLLVSAHK